MADQGGPPAALVGVTLSYHQRGAWVEVSWQVVTAPCVGRAVAPGVHVHEGLAHLLEAVRDA